MNYDDVLIVTSPNYPRNYGNSDCKEWIISSSPGTILNVDITDVEVMVLVQMYHTNVSHIIISRLSHILCVILMPFESMTVKTKMQNWLLKFAAPHFCFLLCHIQPPAMFFIWLLLLTVLITMVVSQLLLQSIIHNPISNNIW